MEMTYKKPGNRKIAWQLGMLVLFFGVLAGGCGGNESNSTMNASETILEDSEINSTSNTSDEPIGNNVEPQTQTEGTNWADVPRAEQSPDETTTTDSPTTQNATTSNTAQ